MWLVHIFKRVVASYVIILIVFFASSPQSFSRKALGDYLNDGHITLNLLDDNANIPLKQRIREFILGRHLYTWRGNDPDKLVAICNELRRTTKTGIGIAWDVNVAYHAQIDKCVANPRIVADTAIHTKKSTSEPTFECVDEFDGKIYRRMRHQSSRIAYIDVFDGFSKRERVFENMNTCLVHFQIEL
jgi:hypothetical protein